MNETVIGEVAEIINCKRRSQCLNDRKKFTREKEREREREREEVP